MRNLFWIRRDLWKKREFEMGDCYPAQEGDRWVKKPTKLNFAEDMWGKGERETFISKLMSMANRSRGGRGPNRPRN